ncbi:RNA polymerase sigma factor [Nesterenkonia marinintestina]|uniref:RNA polymerase sigma factor n=1 Tax=Nesterenkonia marinintestina TaxID=2979865 RepID=UPI0021C23188|nr:DUF6596 domain-containing protein [Nesterenkonia sp. GX14115]
MRETTDVVLARFFRDEHSRLLAVLVRRFGSLDLAEEAAQEAMAAALETWPRDGMPSSPLAWLITAARRRALDRVRRDAVFARRIAELRLQEELAPPSAEDDALDALGGQDERLAMLMGCCHPAISGADQIALMLRFVGGLTTAEVAQSLLLPVPTVQARITRAKKRIRANRIPLEVPDDPGALQARLPSVLTAISLIFTEGYDATAGDSLLRRDLTSEAVRLARIVQTSLPEEAEPCGLLGLLLLTEARASARVDADGVPVALEDQDRGLWDGALTMEGLALVERAAAMPSAGRFTVQGAIAAVHAEARDFDSTDWRQIVALYDILLHHRDDPVVRMNRAVAVGRRDGPEAGLRGLLALADEPELTRHRPFHVCCALFYDEVHDAPAASASWARALELAENEAQRQFIARRLVPDRPAP